MTLILIQTFKTSMFSHEQTQFHSVVFCCCKKLRKSSNMTQNNSDVSSGTINIFSDHQIRLPAPNTEKNFIEHNCSNCSNNDITNHPRFMFFFVLLIYVVGHTT